MRKRASLLAGLGFLLALAPGFARAAERQIPATTSVNAYATVLRHVNPNLPTWQSRDLARHLLVNAHRWNVSPNILAAIVTVESAWRTHAVSDTGALGLGQLMPGTAAGLGVNPRDPAQNLDGAAHYLSGLLHEFAKQPNHYELAFAAYNAGPKAVVRYGGIPPYYETQHYVVKVLAAWHELQGNAHLRKNDTFDEATIAAAQGDDVDYWLSAR